jgi:hypothetical protein
VSGEQEGIGAVEREVDAVARAQADLTEDAEIGVLAVLHEQARTAESRAASIKEETAKRIIMRMDSMGLDQVKSNGRRLAFRTNTYYGIVEGQLQAAKDFLESVAPEVNVPASTNIKKAVEAYLDGQPQGTPIPACIAVTQSKSLVNAKA